MLKKTIFLSLAVFFASGLFSGAQAAPKSALILSVTGNVQIELPGESQWHPGAAGTELPQGSQVLTAGGSYCEISLGEARASAIKLNPESKATLTSLDPVKVDLVSGKIFSLVRGLKKGSTFRVQTPSAIASARGTGWAETDKKVEVFESDVDVEGKNGESKDVPEGKGVDIDDNGGLGDLFDNSQDSKNEFSDFKEDAQEKLGGGEDKDKNSDSDGGSPAADQLSGSTEHDQVSDAKDDSRETKDQDFIDKQLKPEEEHKETGHYPG